jgi:hypothetical protein
MERSLNKSLMLSWKLSLKTPSTIVRLVMPVLRTSWSSNYFYKSATFYRRCSLNMPRSSQSPLASEVAMASHVTGTSKLSSLWCTRTSYLKCFCEGPSFGYTIKEELCSLRGAWMCIFSSLKRLDEHILRCTCFLDCLTLILSNVSESKPLSVSTKSWLLINPSWSLSNAWYNYSIRQTPPSSYVLLYSFKGLVANPSALMNSSNACRSMC